MSEGKQSYKELVIKQLVFNEVATGELSEIKKHLEKLNNRTDKNSTSIAWIKGVGATIVGGGGLTTLILFLAGAF